MIRPFKEILVAVCHPLPCKLRGIGSGLLVALGRGLCGVDAEGTHGVDEPRSHHPQHLADILRVGVGTQQNAGVIGEFGGEANHEACPQRELNQSRMLHDNPREKTVPTCSTVSVLIPNLPSKSKKTNTNTNTLMTNVIS